MVILPPSRRRYQRVSGLNDVFTDVVTALQSTEQGREIVSKATTAVTDFATQQIVNNFKQAAFYSAYSKPVIYTGKDLSDFITGRVKSLTAPPPPRAPSKLPPIPEALKQKTLIERVKPTFVIEGSFGRKVVAPFGEADPEEWKGNVRNLVLMGLAGVALWSGAFYYLGYKKGQRSK